MAKAIPVSKSIILERHPLEDGGDLLVATLNKPKTMNAFSMQECLDAVKMWDAIAVDPSIRVVVITGAGKAFSAGADLTVAAQIFQGTVSPTAPEMDTVAAMERVQVPIIGAINGPAITGGFEMALGCDILIASPNALFIDTHAKFGIHPCWGLSQKLQRLIGANRARHFSLSALPITAENAERWGLVSQIVPADQLVETAVKLAKQIAGNHPGLVQKYKSIINAGGAIAYGESRELERTTADKYYKAMSPEDFKGMQKFLLSRSKGKKKGKKGPKAKL